MSSGPHAPQPKLPLTPQDAGQHARPRAGTRHLISLFAALYLELLPIAESRVRAALEREARERRILAPGDAEVRQTSRQLAARMLYAWVRAVRWSTEAGEAVQLDARLHPTVGGESEPWRTFRAAHGPYAVDEGKAGAIMRAFGQEVCRGGEVALTNAVRLRRVDDGYEVRREQSP